MPNLIETDAVNIILCNDQCAICNDKCTQYDCVCSDTACGNVFCS